MERNSPSPFICPAFPAARGEWESLQVRERRLQDGPACAGSSSIIFRNDRRKTGTGAGTGRGGRLFAQKKTAWEFCRGSMSVLRPL